MIRGNHSTQRHTRRTIAMTYSSRTLISVLALGALVLGCSPAAAPSVSPGGASSQPATAAPSQPASAAPSALASASGIILQRTGPIACDSIGVDYTSATIRIDAASDPDVWAEANTGKKLAVKWTDGFTATDGPPPVINGPKGEEVARDGTVIVVPADSYPRLVGYFVCLSPDTLWVLETDS
jgi:hypothetical protein